MELTSTGYGPRQAQGQYSWLCFDGDERHYEQWEVKFLGYMRLQKLKDTILPPEGAEIDGDKNEAFAELIQFLDEKSLSLIMRDARDDGKKALEILMAHYAGSGKPRIISLYTELTYLIKHPNESVTDYVITAETASAALSSVGENVSDSLLIAMVLKGFPESFKPFVTHDSVAIARICYGNSVCLSAVCLSHGWISQKRLKLGSRNFHHTVAPSL